MRLHRKFTFFMQQRSVTFSFWDRGRQRNLHKIIVGPFAFKLQILQELHARLAFFLYPP